MAKIISSPEELKKLQKKAKAEIDLREGPKEISITVHMGTCGIAAGARDIMLNLADEICSVDNVILRQSGCIGSCDQEPTLTITDKSGSDFLYVKLDRRKVHEIVREHVQSGNPVSSYLIKELKGD